MTKEELTPQQKYWLKYYSKNSEKIKKRSKLTYRNKKKENCTKNVIVLKGLRYREGFTKKEMAEKLNISINEYIKIENGSIQFDENLTEQLADILNTHKRMFE